MMYALFVIVIITQAYAYYTLNKYVDELEETLALLHEEESNVTHIGGCC